MKEMAERHCNEGGSGTSMPRFQSLPYQLRDK